MKNFWFVEHNTGEEFFVLAGTKREAFAIAKSLDWEEEIELECIGAVSDETAEWMGFDTY